MESKIKPIRFNLIIFSFFNAIFEFCLHLIDPIIIIVGILFWCNTETNI